MYAENIKLVEPTIKLKDEFLAMAKEEKVTGIDIAERWMFEEALADFEKFVAKLHDHAKGKNLPNGWVQSSTYWLMGRNNLITGRSGLRHQLSPALRTFGGHIGYYIRPSQRQKGHGMRILSLTLEKAKQLGLKRVLVTCDDNNIASIRIIEANGGKLEDKIMNEGHKVPTRRYWINLKLRET